MPTACRSARHCPFTRPTKHADTFWLYKHQIMSLNSLCVTGSAWHCERLGQDSAARFATHLVHAVTKLWPMERIDSTYLEYKRAVSLSYSLCTPATHIPTLYITLNHTNRAPQTSTSASTPVQLPHCTLHGKYHALCNRSPFLPRLIQEPLRRRDPTPLIAQPGD